MVINLSYFSYSVTKCNARLITRDNVIVDKKGVHSHAPDVRYREKQESMNELKVLTKTTNLPRRAVVLEVCAGVKSEAVSAIMPAASSMMNQVSRIRTKEQIVVNPTSVLDLKIDEPYAHTNSLGCFVLFDSGPAEERTVAFGSRRCMRFLSQCKSYHIDGTFDVAPPIFKQFYTILGN